MSANPSLVRYKSGRAIQAIGGPGKTGIKHPTKPTTIIAKPRSVIIQSIIITIYKKMYYQLLLVLL
jgi:hypothetical protein